MLLKRHLIIGLIIIILALVIGRSFLTAQLDDWQISRRLNGNAEWLADYQKIKEIIARDQKEPNDIGRQFTLGLAWKSLGEKTQDKFFFEKSLAVYRRGAEYFGAKNILFYWNAGKLAEELERYDEAEKYYLKSIKLGESYAEGYQYLAELYQYKLKSPKEKILAVYEEGIKKLFNAASLIQGRASYLRSIGDYEAALKDYELLAQNFPNSQAFKDVVKELEAKAR